MKLLSGSTRKLVRLKAVIISTALFNVVLISGTTLAQPAPPPFRSTGPKAQLFDDSIIVKYKESTLKSNVPSQRKEKMNNIAAGLHARYGVRAIRTLPILGVQLFRIDPRQHLNVVIQALRKHPKIEYAEYNFRIIGEQSPPPKDPTDPQWLAGSFWGLSKIGMRSAWGYQTDASNIIVAVIDSGIDYDHPDLFPNMYTDQTLAHGYNFCDNNDDARDTIHHGTAVAGIIGARGNNNYGGVGTDWKVQMVALKALCNLNAGIATGGVAQAEAAIEWAVAIGAHIINNSWRLDPDIPPSQLQNQINILEGAVRQTNCEGPVAPCVPALFVASAGNGRPGEPLNNDPCTAPNTNCGAKVYPANFGATPYNISNVISVAATDCPNSPCWSTNHLWINSHYGSQTVHIAAPGVNIFTTDLWDDLNPDPAMSYSAGEGTSMAAPHVSGCAALLQARNLSLAGTLLSIAQLTNLLFTNADTPTPFDGKIIGRRSLSCAKAIAAIQ